MISQRRFLSIEDVREAAMFLAEQLLARFGRKSKIVAYPVPRGGVPAAFALQQPAKQLQIDLIITDNPLDADIILDDLIDSGATREKYIGYEKPFYALFAKDSKWDKSVGVIEANAWLVFPWEASEVEDFSSYDIVTRMLQVIGENPNREGLQETPKRVTHAWNTWFSGYIQKPGDVMKAFEDGAEGVDEMVIEVDIPFYTHCEHHLAPFFGLASVAYVPNGKVLGLSKMNRLVDVFARRLQVQERLTNQIADALDEHLSPKGVGVLVRARHLCVESRGVKHRGCSTTTSALRGCLKDEPDARAEFLALAKTNTPI